MSKTSTDNLIVEGPRSTRGSIPTKALYYETAADEKKSQRVELGLLQKI